LSKEPVVVQSRGLSLKEVKAAKTVDTRGQVCPYPSFETARALDSLDKGEILEVLTDSEISAVDSIPTVCRRRDLQYLVVKDEGHWRVYVRK
jgi:tRNA 2-thiouridine synthesizing protein A